MPIFTDGLRGAPGTDKITDYESSLGASLGATVSDTLADSPTSQLLGIGELEAAKGNDLSRMSGIDDGETFGGPPAPAPVVPTIGKLEASERVKAAGLDKDLKLPDQDTIAVPALDIMINRARERREREATIQRGPQGILQSTALVGTSFLVGAIDPLNLASSFIPVMGELRYAKLLASAGESFAGRTAIRMGVGGAEGVVGQAALEPLDWYAHTQDGRDFGMADVLHNLVFGAALGGGLHAAGGGIRDIYRARKGLAQYPFGPGEPMERVDGTHVPESVLAEQGVAHADLPAHLQPVMDQIDQVLSSSPAMATLRDLPPRAHEDSMRAALASIVDGEPVKVGEMLDAAAQTDPRIAESFEAWHGSPHEFDRFDLSKIGSGEGAASYGHGFYLAESKTVAENYQESLARPTVDGRSASSVDPEHIAATYLDQYKTRSAAIAKLDEDLNWSDGNPQFALKPDEDKAARAAKGLLENGADLPHVGPARGNIYRVKINADHQHFLDWDKPLSQQPQAVRDFARQHNIEIRHPGTISTPGPLKEDPAGSEIYHTFQRMKFADLKDRDATAPFVSTAMRDAGIPGIRYLDQGSRDAGEGTRNFVVFDDKHIEIIDRNGEPVARPFTEPATGNPKITLGTDAVAGPKPRGRAAAHPDTLSLNEHLASKGGLAPHPELEAVYGSRRGPFVPGFGPLIRKGGKSLDEALSSAKQHGYMFDPHDADNGTAGTGGRTSMGLTPRDLLDHLDNENRGQKLYKAGHLEGSKFDPEQERHVVLGHVEAEFEAAGLKVADIDGKLLDRTAEIVHREGERDVLAAYERAIMEDEERYHAVAQARDAAADHPARDVPFDAGTAPDRGGEDPVAGGPAGRAGPSERGTDGAQPPRNGAGDIRPSDAAFRDLSATEPGVNDAGLLEASRAADRLPEQVETNLDKRVTAAEKADAYAKQMYDMFADRLPAEERQRLDDVIRAIDDDAAVRKEAIERSGACLFGARA